MKAIDELARSFKVLPDKIQVWSDLILLTKDGDPFVRWFAADVLSVVFPYIAGWKQAWEDLHRLVQDEDSFVRRGAVDALGNGFSNIQDKEQAWEDLHRLVQDNNDYVRWGAAEALGKAFAHITNKRQAYEDLHNLTNDDYSHVLWGVTSAFCLAFPHLPDKKQAWEDITRLTYDGDYCVRRGAADALGIAFPHISDKEKAWEDLVLLTQDEDSDIRRRAAGALGSIYSYVPDREQAWTILVSLKYDVNSDVRASSNHSLGRASIFKATEAENEEIYREELENALEFFEIASMESYDTNPARFCLPFYRSLYSITFRKDEAEIEVKRCLIEARSAVEGSESKEKLLEIIEALGNALKDAQNAQKMDFNSIKSDLDSWRRHCERAADLLDATEKKAPGATKLIRRGLPLIDHRIKEIITEIQEKARALCKQALDTPFEDLGKEVNQMGQNLLKIRDPIGLEKNITNLQVALSAICAKIPDEERGEACELLKRVIKEPYIEDKLSLINMVLSKIPSQMGKMKDFEKFEKKLDELMLSLKPGMREELVISVGVEFGGTGAQHVITIPLQEISYPDLKKDLEKINGMGILKLSSLPAKLAEKIKSHLVRNKKDDLQYRK